MSRVHFWLLQISGVLFTSSCWFLLKSCLMCRVSSLQLSVGRQVWSEWDLLITVCKILILICLFAYLFCLFFWEWAHPHLEPNYTGDERTHGWNIFCWPFLTKTKREWPFSGHFQSKFLLGALHFALYFFDTKIYEFWGKNRAVVWLHLYSWAWIDLTNVCGITFWWFFFFLVPLLLV